MKRHQLLPSCTGDHFTAAATTTPAPATTSLQRQLLLLHRRPLPCRSSCQSCTSDRLPVLAITFLHQQTPVATFLHQQIPAATSSASATTSPKPVTTFLHQQTPATTSPEPATTFLHQQTPATSSSGPANTFQHQQIPVVNQLPPIQRIPVLYQLSRPDPATRSCSNDHHPATAIVRRTLFRFTIRHNKIWPFEENPCFVISCLVRCQSLIFQTFAGTGIFI